MSEPRFPYPPISGLTILLASHIVQQVITNIRADLGDTIQVVFLAVGLFEIGYVARSELPFEPVSLKEPDKF